MKQLSWLHVVLAFAFASIVGSLIKQFYLHGEVQFQNEDIFMTTPAIQNESEVSVSHHNHNDLLLSVPFYVYDIARSNLVIKQDNIQGT
jgi:hypothetical protein